ncbi:MAG: hypothetical protein CL674_06460 [Bdellovibrionaceae bacterium]|nr:hypothetical protein [Pseudobdellovibrionaceae bacterium]|tara:strand:- start:839 stop:2728 length:1890 start_codon:yes stop_codon:yes gene_type:complete
MKIRSILLCLLFVMSNVALASKSENELAVHLLSYLAQDYGEAVENGKVISKEEYQEQLDFSNEVLRISSENNYDNDLKNSVLALNRGILEKKSVKEVSSMANNIKADILRKFNLLTYPKKPLNLVRAHQLFKENCMSCHGQSGYGDGKDGVGLEPAPTNFHDLERMQNVSPYGAFNTITLGVNGTGMAGHDYLSEEDRWSLAYYVTAFRFKNVKKVEGIRLDIKDGAALSDNEIKEKFGLDEQKSLGVLASIRDNNSNPPSNGGKKNQLEIHIAKAIKDLKQSLSLYTAGHVKEARNLSLEAYLQGIEPVEGILKSKDEKLVIELETSLAKYRGLLGKKSSNTEIESVLNPIVSTLEAVINSTTLEKTKSSSFLMSFGIVLREAFEAGLILFLLLSLTRKSNATIFNKHIHLGWISSVTIGLGAYFVLGSYFNITGKLAESLEGYTALVASLLLFYVGYWMHKNTDVQKLKDKFISAVDTSIGSGKGVALFFIAFTASFREIFETILFLKILILDGHQQSFVGLGAISAVLLTFTVIAIAIKFSIKLNLKYLFKASTVLILSLSTIFLGKGIGALQKTGAFSQTSIDVFSLPVIGFNSTLEVLIAQMTMIVLMLSFFIVTRVKLAKGMV